MIKTYLFPFDRTERAEELEKLVVNFPGITAGFEVARDILDQSSRYYGLMVPLLMSDGNYVVFELEQEREGYQLSPLSFYHAITQQLRSGETDPFDELLEILKNGFTSERDSANIYATTGNALAGNSTSLRYIALSELPETEGDGYLLQFRKAECPAKFRDVLPEPFFGGQDLLTQRVEPEDISVVVDLNSSRSHSSRGRMIEKIKFYQDKLEGYTFEFHQGLDVHGHSVDPADFGL